MASSDIGPEALEIYMMRIYRVEVRTGRALTLAELVQVEQTVDVEEG